jgi:exodeoxyribonuclease-5
MDGIEWSDQQSAAIEKFEAWQAAWRRDHAQQIFRLAGSAGTGKTTLARHLGGSGAIFTTFTGKAAHNLRRKGCPGAIHLDQWLYRPTNGASLEGLDDEEDDDLIPIAASNVAKPGREPRHNGEFERRLAPPRDLSHVRLIVVDEASMVPDDMVDDLLDLGLPILALYDAAQLPPIGGAGRSERLAGKPDVFLTEIHRQARNNPIIRLSMLARMGARIRPGVWGDGCAVVPKHNLEPIVNCNADMILCGTNRTRKLVNDAVRARDSRTEWWPEPGERLVCLRNWRRRGLLNGSLWIARKTSFAFSNRTMEDLILLDLVPEEGGSQRRIVLPVERYGDFFDYGYCLTVHKAQGSEWNSVLVINESRAMMYGARQRGESFDPRKWLYTAITRASEGLVLVGKLVT